MTQTLTAQDFFKAAYDNRYTWDSDFSGYTADVIFTHGEQTHTGRVQVKADMSFEVMDLEDETAKKEIQGQLWEVTIHRVRHSFEDSHGKNTFEFGAIDDDGAREILVGGASMGNTYKVKDNIVCFVNRKIRNVIVNINTFKILMTDEGYLSEGYDSVYLDPETGVQQGAKTVFRDTFEKVGRYYILAERNITSEQDGTSKTFRFSNITLS